MLFQVGVTYKHRENERIFLAISPSELLTFRNSKPLTIAPYFRDRYAICAHASVDSLLTLWGISAERLDEVALALLKRDFKPSRVVTNTKKHSVAQEMALGDELRAVRCAIAL